MDALYVANREIKIGFRNPWSYSFMALFSLFSLSLLFINAQQTIEGYTNITGTMLNFILYLLPLMTLLIGSFSLTAEKEEGSWQLLSTYPISTLSFILGKYAGLLVVLLTIIAFGYGLTGMVGVLFGNGFDTATFVQFAVFSTGLVVLYLAIALGIGTLAANRWQALTIGVAVWFFTVIGWPTLLIAILGIIPYLWIKPVLIALTFLNPAELVRIFVVVKLGGGSILGPEYYKWVQWIYVPDGTFYFIVISFIWVAIAVGTAYFFWERGRARG
ncbi:ABC transporter permease [Paenibacillus marinisediminis]